MVNATRTPSRLPSVPSTPKDEELDARTELEAEPRRRTPQVPTPVRPTAPPKGPPSAPTGRRTRGSMEREKRRIPNPFKALHRPHVRGSTIASLKQRIIGDLVLWGLVLPLVPAALGSLAGFSQGVSVARAAARDAGTRLLLGEAINSALKFGGDAFLKRYALASSVCTGLSLINPVIVRVASWGGSPPPPGSTWMGIIKVSDPATDWN